MRAQEDYPNAIRYLKAAVWLCPGRNTQAVIDSITYFEHRIWVKGEGAGDKFAIANTLGELVEKDKSYNPYRFSNPQQFRNGIAIYSENNKYFFVDKNGEVLTPKPGYDGIIATEDDFYYLIRRDKHALTLNWLQVPALWRDEPKGDTILSVNEFITFENIEQIRDFLIQTNGKYEDIGDFRSGLASVRKRNVYGFINNHGTEIYPLKFNRVIRFTDGLAIARLLKKEFMVNTSGQQISATYDRIYNIEAGCAIVETDYKKGVINKKGEETIPPHYKNIMINKNGTIWYQEDKLWGLFKQDGQKIINPIYEYVSDFSEGLAQVTLDDQYGFVDSLGNEVVKTIYQMVKDFSGGYAPVQRDGKWSLIDRTGKEVFKPKYMGLHSIDHGYARANEGGYWNGEFVTDGKWGLIDTQGEVQLPIEYDWVRDFEDSIAVIEYNGKCGLIDISMKHLLDPTFDEIKAFVNGMAKVNVGGIKNDRGQITGGNWGFIDKKGRKVVPPVYEGVGDFYYGLAWVLSNGNYYFIDTSGRIQMDTCIQYDEVNPYNGGVARAKKGALWTVIDSSGRPIFKNDYFHLRDFKDSLAVVNRGGWVDHSDFISEEMGGLYGAINMLGEELIKPQFMGLWDYENGLAWAADTLKRKFGIIDKEGKVVLPFQYDYARKINRNFTEVRLDGKRGLVGRQGKEIVKPGSYKFYEFFNLCDYLAVADSSTYWLFFNQQGNVVFRLDSTCDVISQMQNGHFLVWKNSGVSILDSTGRNSLQLEFDSAQLFQHGFAKIKKDGCWGLIDHSGNTILGIGYDWIGPLNQNLAVFRRENYSGVVDKYGRIVIPLTSDYSIVSNFYQNRAIVKRNGKYGCIDSSGFEVIKTQYEKIDFLFNGLVRFWKDERWGILDANGNELLKPTFGSDRIELTNKTIKITTDFETGYVDSKGRIILPPVAEGSQVASIDKVLLFQGGKKGMLSLNDETCIAPEYDQIANYHDRLILVRKNGKWGWVDHTGTAKIPCNFDAATPFDANGKAWVFQFGLRFQINRFGEMIQKR